MVMSKRIYKSDVRALLTEGNDYGKHWRSKVSSQSWDGKSRTLQDLGRRTKCGQEW